MKENKKEVKLKSKRKISKEKKIKEKKITDLEGNEIKIKKPKKEKAIDKLKRHFSKYKKLYRIILIAILLVIIGIASYIGIRNYVLNKKYGEYEKTMDNYGFSLLYNNKSPKSSENVTKAEMIKLVLGAVYNIDEVESKGFISQGEFNGDEWTSLAVAFDIIDEKYITKHNFDEEVTYMETLITLLNARNVVLDIPVSNTVESKFKNLHSYTNEQKKYINDAAESGLIDNNSKKINLNNNIYKGELNKLIVTFVEKYNTISPKGETLVTKKESKPQNADIYPYIVYSIDKEVYEYDPLYGIDIDYKTPAETYKYKKAYYSQVKYRSELYYNQILNIDYETIEKDDFYNKVSEYLRYNYEEDIKNYVDYVKKNKIKIEGKATVQLPIFYLDGLRYRARMKLTFKILNSDTDKNLLLGDTIRVETTTYKNKEYTLYVDVPMGTTYYGRSLLLDMDPIIELIVNNKEAINSNEF